jgi:hypothetical protein
VLRTPFSPTSPGAYLSPTGPNNSRRWPINDNESVSNSSTDESSGKQNKPERPSILLLFWPKTVDCEEPEGEQWVVGWNPQGLVVVVTGFIKAKSLSECDDILCALRSQVADEVQTRLEKIRIREIRTRKMAAGVECIEDNATPVYDDIADLEETLRLVKYLKVVGRLNHDRNDLDSEGPEGEYFATRRRVADIWIELSSAVRCSPSTRGGIQRCAPGVPTINELLCCSYRHSAALHLVPFEPTQQYSTQSIPLTALSRLPDAGLNQFETSLAGAQYALAHPSRKALLQEQSAFQSTDELTTSILEVLEKQRKSGFVLAPGALSILEGHLIDRHAQHVLGQDDPTPKSIPRCVTLIEAVRNESKSQAAVTLDDDADGFFSSPDRRAEIDVDDQESAEESDAGDDNSASVVRHDEDEEEEGSEGNDHSKDDGSNSVRRHSLPGNESVVTNDSTVSHYADLQGSLSAQNYFCRAQRLIMHLNGGDALVNNSSLDSTSQRRLLDNDSISRMNSSFLDVRNVLFSMLAMPPRLAYRSKEAATEFNIVLACCNHSLWLQQKLSLPTSKEEAAKGSSGSDCNDVKLSSSLMQCDRVTVLDVALEKCQWVLELISVFVAKGLLPVVVPLCPYSYVVRFAEFRLQMILNAIALASGKSSTCGLHPGLPHCVTGTSKRQRSACLLGFVFQLLFDSLLGILATYLLFKYEADFLALFRSFAWHGLHGLHLGYLEWFVGWPAGFKMNDDLNVLLAAFSNGVLEGWRWLVYLSPELHWLEFALTIARMLCPLGLGFGFSLVADYCNICTLHLRNTFHVFKVVYRGYLALLSSLTKQFQGRRYNPLKNRIDMGTFDHDQMLLGTLVATAAVFLFPTLAMYYFYFAFVRTSVWVVQEGLCGASFAIAFLPFGQVAYWWLFKNSITCGVNFSNAKVEMVPASTPHTPPTPIVCLTMERKPMELGEALHDWKFVLRTCLRPLAPGRLAAFIVSATHKPAINPRGTIYGHLVGAQGEPFLPNFNVVRPSQESSSS